MPAEQPPPPPAGAGANSRSIYSYRLDLAQRKLGMTAREMAREPDRAWAALQQTYSNVHSRANTVCALWVHMKDDPGVPAAARQRWAEIYRGTSDAARAIYESNEPTERQVAGTVPYSLLLSVRDALPMGSPQRLLLAMYTYIDPLRNDFHALEVFDRPPESAPVHNYVVLSSSTLYLQQYKTARIYNTLEIPLPDKLVFEIAVSLKLRPRRHVFVMKNGSPYTNEHSFCAWANAQLKRLLGNPDITLTMIRHIFITEKTVGMTLAQRKTTARNMGHSVVMQLGYALVKPSTAANPGGLK